MTIDSEQVIKTMLENNGIYPEDPQAYSIHTYINDWNNRTYHVSMSSASEDSMFASPYVHNPILMWSKGLGLTEWGKAWLRVLNKTEKENK